jgi:hypothetical protein
LEQPAILVEPIMPDEMPEYAVFHPDPAILAFGESLILRISACQKGRFNSNTNGLNISENLILSCL